MKAEQWVLGKHVKSDDGEDGKSFLGVRRRPRKLSMYKRNKPTEQSGQKRCTIAGRGDSVPHGPSTWELEGFLCRWVSSSERQSQESSSGAGGALKVPLL